MNERTADTAIADAMNRVLAAEREAAEAIAVEQRAAEALIEAARDRRRRILDTARRRATTLHVRARARLRAALAELEQGHASPDTRVEALRAVAREAIDGLARHLTSVGHDSG